jgi:hypothetical protein
MGKKIVTEAATMRRLIAQRGSLYINVPREFIKRHELKAGDRLSLVVSAGSIKLVPFEREHGS